MPGAWRKTCRYLPLGPMLFFHIGTSNKGRGELESVSHGYMALMARMKGLGLHMHMIFSLILSMRGKGFRTSGQILQLNAWLCILC